MTEDDPTKDLTDQMSDRQLLLELRRAVTTLTERFEESERRTNPLPPNFDARFTAIEERIGSIETDIKDIKREIILLREDIRNERRERVILGERVEALENRPN
jgi:chromosome segregation ATPase